jgi:hypothetical protein
LRMEMDISKLDRRSDRGDISASKCLSWCMAMRLHYSKHNRTTMASQEPHATEGLRGAFYSGVSYIAS